MTQLKTAIVALITGDQQQAEKLMKEYITAKSAAILTELQVPRREENNEMNQYIQMFDGKLGVVAESDGSEVRLGSHTVKAVTDTEEGIDEFYVDGELVDFYEPIEKDVDFSTIPLVCFKSEGYRGIGCYFCLGLLDGQVVLIDTMEGAILGQ